MIRNMRLKIVAVSMSALILLLVSIFVSTNLFMKEVATRDVEYFLERVLEHDGELERIISPGDHEPGRVKPIGPTSQGLPINAVILALDDDGKVISVLANNDSIDEALLLDYVDQIFMSDDRQGTIEDYAYRVKKNDEGYYLALANTLIQNKILEDLQSLSFWIGLASIGVLLILIFLLAKFITRPVEDALEKQKRFIADSSHELKTPLSIISANLDLLEMETGQNQRTGAMKSGIRRMNGLIHEMLTLAKTEHSKKDFIKFDMGQTMERAILPLEVIAYESGKSIDIHVEKDVMMMGDEKAIEKAIVALMENAIKYSADKTVIRSSLVRKNNQIILEVFNEGIGVTKEQKERLFNTFYRVDDSRHRETGGHGLGLAIVKSVVELHKGKILVDSVPGEYVLFRMIFKIEG